MKKKCIVVRRHLACRRKLAEGEHSFHARCESNIRGRFASLFRIALRVERPLAWLVLPTFAAGSDVSVVIKREIQFVLCIFNRHLWSHESIICSWSYRFGWAQKLCLNLYIYFELYRRNLQRWLCSIRCSKLDQSVRSRTILTRTARWKRAICLKRTMHPL